jgi:type III secretory pathway component EscS
MDGDIFLGFLWAVWLIATFFLNKQNVMRFPAAVLSLILIISFPFSVPIFSFTIKLPAVIFLAVGYYYINSLPFTRKLYMILSVMIITAGFTGALLMELYDPIWMFMDRRIILGGIVFLLGQFLYPHSLYKCLSSMVIATIHGEIILSIFLSKWGIQYPIASEPFLDICSVYLSFTIIWHLLNQISSYVSVRQSVKNERQY